MFDGAGSLAQLVTSLPIGDRVTSILADPEQIVDSFKNADLTKLNVLELCQALNNSERPVLNTATSKACDKLLALPNLEEIVEAFTMIKDIPTGVVEGVADVVQNKVVPKAISTTNKACKRLPLRIRNRLCP